MEIRERQRQFDEAINSAKFAVERAESDAREFNESGATSWAQISLAWSAIANLYANRSGIQRVEVVNRG